MIEDQKRRILKRAKKMAKRRYRSEQYRRYYHQYNNLEVITTSDFDKKVSGQEETTNIIDITINKTKSIQPAMPIATHLHLYKKRLMSANG